MQIAVVNQTTVLADKEIVPKVQAAQTWLFNYVAKFWNASAWLSFVGRDQLIPPNTWQLLLRDTSDLEGALGYHDRTVDGLPVGYVFVKTDLESGALWSVTFSHELGELRIDPWTDLYSQGRVNGQVVFRAYEICDPPEGDEFAIMVNGIPMSNFVTPRYFQDGAKNGPYDAQGLIKRPGELLPGGYQNIFSNGKFSDIVAEHAPNYKPPFPGSRRWLRQIRHERITSNGV